MSKNGTLGHKIASEKANQNTEMVRQIASENVAECARIGHKSASEKVAQWATKSVAKSAKQKGSPMIDALIQGKIYGQPVQRTAKTGKPFAVAKVRCAAGDGESLFVSVIAFDAEPCAALLALGDGDSVAMSGTLTPKIWTDKTGAAKPTLDLVAQQVLTSYHVQRKRKAVSSGQDDG